MALDLYDVLEPMYQKARTARAPVQQVLSSRLQAKISDDGRLTVWGRTQELATAWAQTPEAVAFGHACAKALGWRPGHYAIGWRGIFLTVYLLEGPL